jgi:hypothetical protein
MYEHFVIFWHGKYLGYFSPKLGHFFNFWTCLGSLGDTSKYRIIPYLFVALVVEAKASNVAIAITANLPI